MAATRIFTDVSYEKDGKQIGWLYLPYFVTRSAYGNIAIPVAVIKSGEGPTVLLTAGNHGDEYEGQVAFVDNPGREPVTAHFRVAGTVISKRHLGRVERADCVAHLATDWNGW